MKPESPFMTWQEVCNLAEQEEAELNKRVTTTTYGILLDDHYEIEWSRCKTAKDILLWISHIAEKGWVTGDMIIRVIELATKHHKIRLPKGV